VEDESAASAEELRAAPVEDAPQEEVAPTRTGRTGAVVEDVSQPTSSATELKGDLGAAPAPTSVQTVYPKFADLRPSGIMLSRYGDTLKAAWVSVFNHGPGALNAHDGKLTIRGVPYEAQLRTTNGVPVTDANPLAPNKAGYLVAVVPHDAFALCSTYLVTIDSDPETRLQWRFDGTDIFSNDTGNVKTPCLYWTSLMSRDLLEADYKEDYLGGKTLQQIVGGKYSFAENKKCTNCHNNSPNAMAGKYKPPVGVGGEFVPDKDVYYDGRTWAGPGGWAERFVNTMAYDKPPHMRGIFGKWVAHGSR
jgi:hypothetical protein